MQTQKKKLSGSGNRRPFISRPQRSCRVSNGDHQGGLKKSVLWSFHSPILGDDAIQYSHKLYDQTEKFIEKVQITGAKGGKRGSWEVFLDINSKFVFEFLEFYYGTLNQSGTKKDLERLIRTKNEYPKWNVGVHIPQKKKEYAKILEMKIGLVNRSIDKSSGDRLKIIQSSHNDSFVDFEEEQQRGRYLY